MLLLRVMLGMEPRADTLTIAPHVPRWFGAVALRGVPGRWGRTDVVVDAD